MVMIENNNSSSVENLQMRSNPTQNYHNHDEEDPNQADADGISDEDDIGDDDDDQDDEDDSSNPRNESLDEEDINALDKGKDQ